MVYHTAGAGRHGTLRYRARMRIGVAALLVVGVVVVAGCQAAGGEAFQHSFNQPLMLGDEPVGQTFRPVTDVVAGLDVLLATFDEPVDPAGELAAVLRDADDGRVLARATVEPADLGNDEWAPVRFEPAVPAPEVAAVALTWDGETPLAVWANAPLAAPEQVDLRNDPYLGGQLLRGGQPAVGDLAFRVVGADRPGVAGRNLAGLVRAGAGRLADDPLFLGFWLAVLAGALGLGVYGLRRPAGELGEGGRDQQRRDHQEPGA